MKAHLIDTHLLVPRSRSIAKLNVKYEGHTFGKKKKKTNVFEGISVSPTQSFFVPKDRYTLTALS